MADELRLDLSPQSNTVVDAVSHGYQSKAEFMCDRNFAESRRREFNKAKKTIEEILQGRDVAALMQQDPSFVFAVIYRSRQLAAVRNDENEAIAKTYIWFQKKFQQFDITKYDGIFSLMTCLVIWINSYLRPKLKESRLWQRGDDVSPKYQKLEVDYLKRHYKKAKAKDPITGKVIIDEKTGKPKKQWLKMIADVGNSAGDDGEEFTLLDLIDEDRQINLPKSRSAIHTSLAKLEASEIKQTCQELKDLIIQDPDGKLRAMCIDDNPRWNCQEILIRLHIRDERQSHIAKDLGVNNGSITTILRDRAYPYLGGYALSHGYKPETIDKAVLANPKGILTKTKMKDANGKNNCPQTNAYYLAQQLLTAFDEMRSTEEVTRELVDKYQYNITVEMVQQFWDNEGKPAVAKAVRLFNVKPQENPKNPKDAP
jgi:hypothetical protein